MSAKLSLARRAGFEMRSNDAGLSERMQHAAHFWLSDFNGSTWIYTFVMSGSSERMTF